MLRLAAGSLLALLLAAPQAAAISFTRDVTTTTTPNIVNLFLPQNTTTRFHTTAPPIFQGGGVGIWQYQVSADGKFAQLRTSLPYGSLTTELGWSQRLTQVGPVVQPFQIDFQEVHYNYATGTFDAVTYRSTAFGMLEGAYGSAGGSMTPFGPGAPEPRTVLVMALAAALVVAAERRRRRQLQPA